LALDRAGAGDQRDRLVEFGDQRFNADAHRTGRVALFQPLQAPELLTVAHGRDVYSR